MTRADLKRKNQKKYSWTPLVSVPEWLPGFVKWGSLPEEAMLLSRLRSKCFTTAIEMNCGSPQESGSPDRTSQSLEMKNSSTSLKN